MSWTLPAGTSSGYGTASSGSIVSASGFALSGGFLTNDLLLAGVLWYGGGASGTTATCADENGKTYTQVPTNSPSTYDSNAGQIFIFYRIVTGGEGAVPTVTFGNTIVVASCMSLVARPPSGTPSLDNSAKGTGGNGSTTGTPVNTPTVSVSGSDDFLFGAVACSTGATAAGSPWTIHALSPGAFGEAAEYDLTASGNTAANYTSTANGTWTSVAVSFTSGAGTSATISGTATASITEADIVAGGKTIVITLVGDTFIPS